MQQVTTLGIDAAKNLFQLHGVDAHGKVVLKKRLVRHKVLAFVAGLPPCLLGLEASGSAHYWAGLLQNQLGQQRICDRASPILAAKKRRASAALFQPK